MIPLKETFDTIDNAIEFQSSRKLNSLNLKIKSLVGVASQIWGSGHQFFLIFEIEVNLITRNEKCYSLESE